jgi:hypothetical protein
MMMVSAMAMAAVAMAMVSRSQLVPEWMTEGWSVGEVVIILATFVFGTLVAAHCYC